MQKNNEKISIPGTFSQFGLPNTQIFSKMYLKYKIKKTPREIEKFKKELKYYPNIFQKKTRPAKALCGLEIFSKFLYPSNASFKLRTALEGLLLIFLIDDIADNTEFSINYRKKFLKKFIKFIENIKSNNKMEDKDIKQNEMQKIWLSHFRRIYHEPKLKEYKWIKATRDFVKAMINEIKKMRYKTLEKYLNNGILSSGALFYWQSIITEAGYANQNNSRYDKLILQIGKILRLTNDFAQINEDKNKTTALNFLNKKELKLLIEKEIIIFQKILRKSPINKSIRLALWRSAIFLYYFYQKRNF